MSGNNTTTASDHVLLDPSLCLAIGVYLTIVGLVATFGNMTVLGVILPSKKLRKKPHNVLIANLAIADLAISFVGYPLTTISGYRGHWAFGDVACTITAFTSFLFSLGSIDTLLVICIYRYIIICRPDIGSYLTIPVTRIFLYLVWGHALFWSMLPLLGWGKYGFEPVGISCSIAWGDTEFSSITYIVCTLIVCYIVHVVIMTRLYTRIVLKARSLTFGHLIDGRRLNTRTNALWLQKLHTDRHVTLMCFVSTTMFMCVWTPYAVVSAIYPLYPDMPLAVTALPTMFAKAGCMLNPIVYFLTNSAFRKACGKLFKWPRKINVDNRHMASSTTHATTHKRTHYDETTADGVYVGQTTMVVPVETTVF